MFFATCVITLSGWAFVIIGSLYGANEVVPSLILTVLKFYVSIFPPILFIESIEIAEGMLQCSNTEIGQTAVAITVGTSGEIYCWETFHIVLVIIAILFIIFEIILVFAFVILGIEMKMKTGNCLARATNAFDIFSVLQKLAIEFVILIFGYDSTKVFGFTLLLTSGIKIFIVLMYEPYNKDSIQIITLILTSIEFWGTVSLNIEIFLYWIDFALNIFLFIIGSPIFTVMMVYLWSDKSRGLVQLKARNSNNYDLYLKMRQFMKIYEQIEDPENIVWFNGLLNRHSQNCRKRSCLLKEEFEKLTRMDSNCIEDIRKIYGNFIRMKFKKLLNSRQDKVFIRLTYGLFLSEYIHDNVHALAELDSAEDMNPTLSEQFLLARYKIYLEHELNEEKMMINRMTQSNIELALKFESLYNRFKKTLISSAIAFNDIWNYLKNETAEAFRLETMIHKIYITGNIVDKNWEEVLEIKGDIPKVLYMYAKYKFLVLNDIKSAMVLDKKGKTEEVIQSQSHQENEFNLKDMRNIADYASDGTACIYISDVPVIYYLMFIGEARADHKHEYDRFKNIWLRQKHYNVVKY